MRVWFKKLVAFAVFGLFALTGCVSAQAATFYYQTYLDRDGDAATGCTAVVLDNAGATQTFIGVDVSLLATVTGGKLVSVERYNCDSATSALVPAPAAQQDSAHPQYTLGGAFVEYRAAGITTDPQATVGFAASATMDFSASKSDLIPAAPLASLASCAANSSGSAGDSLAIPAITPWLLWVLAVAAGLLAARALKTPQARRLGVLALFVCLAAFSGAVWAAVTIVLDGDDSDWNGVAALATDPQGDAPSSDTDLLAAHGACQGSTLHFKLDLAPYAITQGAHIDKLYCDADFTLSTSGGSGTTLWSSSDPGVVTVNASGAVTITGVGVADITATNGSYTASTTVTVGKSPLTVRADDKTLTSCGDILPLPISYGGFCHGDTPASLTTQPAASTAATLKSPTGDYQIAVSGGASSNYEFVYNNGGTLTIPLMITLGEDGLAHAEGDVYEDTNTQHDSILTSIPGTCDYTLKKQKPIGVADDNNLDLVFHITDHSTRTVQITVSPYVVMGMGPNGVNWEESSIGGGPAVTHIMDGPTGHSASMSIGDLWSSPKKTGITQTITISVPGDPSVTPLVIHIYVI